jgi:hypothetical protein
MKILKWILYSVYWTGCALVGLLLALLLAGPIVL